MNGNKTNNVSYNNTYVIKGNKNAINNTKMELNELAQSSNNLYNNYYSKNINESYNEINYIYNNKKTEGNIQYKKKEIISNDISDINNTMNNLIKNKKIYLISLYLNGKSRMRIIIIKVLRIPILIQIKIQFVLK